MIDKILILNSANFFKKMMFGFVTDIYTTVGKVYDLLLTISDKTSDRSLYDSLYSISNIIYVLMGIFMLFRITISFLNMLIDPDKISDKSAGVSSILKRTLISILLLIAFEPGSFVFNYLEKVQSAILSSGGLIDNITAEIGSTDNITLSNSLVSNVTADTGVSYDCIYVHKKAVDRTTSFDGSKHYAYVFDYDGVVKITISNRISGSEIKSLSNDSLGWYITINNGSVTDSDGYSWPLLSDLSNKNFVIRKNLIDKTFASSSCPKYMAMSSSSKVRLYNSYNTLENDESYINVSSVDDIATFIAEDSKESESEYTKEVSSSYSIGNEELINDYKEQNNILSAEALNFAQTLLRCFIEKYSTAEDETTKKLDNLLTSESANNEVYNIATSTTPQISVDYFLSMLVGVIIMVYLMFICIELIIRNMKLVVLEVLAPIPIISYIDPKDKIFGTWLKMYLTTYVDLFIKLLCISLGLSLLDSVFSVYANASGFEKLLFIIAVVVFIKALPAIINKLFNIDLSSNSFKEIMKTMKTGVALGAAGVGGVIGLGVGAATGTGFGRVTGAARGMVMGMQSGYKKKVFDGAKGVAAKNARINDAKKDGLNFWQRTGAGLAATVGYSPKTKLDNKIKDYTDNKKMMDDWRKHKDNVEEMAEKNNVISDLMVKRENGEIGKEEYKKIRENYIKWMTNKGADGKYSAGTAGNDIFTYSYTDKKTGKRIENQTIKYKDGDATKVQHAFENLQGVYEENSSLRNDLAKNVVDKDGNITSQGLVFANGIKTYQDYLDSETHATNRKNKYDDVIIRTQASDEYRNAVAFDDYSKKSK